MNAGRSPVQLDPLEARITGCLIEKCVTTPEYYPLTAGALLAACNQKNNRLPVTSIDEKTLARGLFSLQEKQLLEFFSGAGARVLKYRELLTATLGLADDERAIICELLLRGPQTAGDLRNRASRMHPFASVEAVQAVIERLAARADGPLVAERPRQPGQKECRVTHLLGDTPMPAEDGQTALQPPAAIAAVMDETARLAVVESRLAALEREVEALKALF